jgi:hypothetical protein
MKKCTYCGKEQPDEAEVCERDGEPLVDVGASKLLSASPGGLKGKHIKAFIKGFKKGMNECSDQRKNEGSELTQWLAQKTDRELFVMRSSPIDWDRVILDAAEGILRKRNYKRKFSLVWGWLVVLAIMIGNFVIDSDSYTSVVTAGLYVIIMVFILVVYFHYYYKEKYSSLRAGCYSLALWFVLVWAMMLIYRLTTRLVGLQ